MSKGPAGFHVAASLRASSLSTAILAVSDACRSAPDVPRLDGWLDTRNQLHEATEDFPGGQRNAALAFAEDAAFGVLELKEGCTFSLGVQHVIDGLSEKAQRAALCGWAEVFRELLRQGVLSGARVARQAGGNCLPYLPLAENATHLVVCSSQEIEHSYTNPEVFARAWDTIETNHGMLLCMRGMGALGNPAFLEHILPGQMAMARAARPGLVRFYQPRFEPGELEFLQTGEPTLTGVGYHAGEQVYEFAGHTPRGIELRCIDLLTARKIVSAGNVDGAGPVREVRAVFMDEEQATRSAKLLQEAGVAVCWEDNQGQLKRVPSVIPALPAQ